MTKPVVTAVGRVLKPKHDEPRIHSIIKITADGATKEVKRETMT